MVNSKSDTETEQPKLAELIPKEIDFTWKIALQAVNSLMFQYTGEYLSDIEILVLHGAWNNCTYEQIAQAKGVSSLSFKTQKNAGSLLILLVRPLDPCQTILQDKRRGWF